MPGETLTIQGYPDTVQLLWDIHPISVPSFFFFFFCQPKEASCCKTDLFELFLVFVVDLKFCPSDVHWGPTVILVFQFFGWLNLSNFLKYQSYFVYQIQVKIMYLCQF